MYLWVLRTLNGLQTKHTGLIRLGASNSAFPDDYRTALSGPLSVFIKPGNLYEKSGVCAPVSCWVPRRET
jgi:hypothetical protein